MKIPRLIPVGRDWALVDEEDYEELKNRKWYQIGNYAKTKRQSNGLWVQMHRLIMGLDGYDRPWLDHRNGNTLDNRKANLRVCNGVENAANKRKKFHAHPDRVTSSQYKGVTFKKSIKRWNARISSNDGKRISLGCYATEEEAARAYNQAAKARYGEFAQLNDC